MKILFKFSFAVHLLFGPQAVLSQAAPPVPEIQPGKVITRVAVSRIPEQSYALYLPEGYTEKKAWPVIYAFDPAARGALPVEMLKQAAEKYGYIVAGSNNSRNGPGNLAFDAMQAMWGDTHQRFSIDNQRVYFTGFSGGARVATMIAKACGCAAGVIGHGAGFMAEFPPDKDIRYSYFAAIGVRDYNFYELDQLGQILDKLGVVNRIRRYDGTHQWATPEVWMEAVEWMEVRSMQGKRRPVDAVFLADYSRRRAAWATAAEQAGDVLAALDEYRRLADDLQGLTDVTAFVARARELQDSPAVEKARRKVQREIREQAERIGTLYADLDVLRDDPRARNEAAQRLRKLLRDLAAEHDRQKGSPDGIVVERSLNQASAGVVSLAEAELFRNGKSLAALCYEIASEGHPKEAWPFYRAARLAAELGEKKRAIRLLERAIANGLPDEVLARFQKDFADLAAEKDFLKLVASRKAAAS